MAYKNKEVASAARRLKSKLKKEEDKRAILRAPELLGLYEQLKTLPVEKRPAFGLEVNQLKQELEILVKSSSREKDLREPIDVTAPMDVNSDKPQLLPSGSGGKHPLSAEIEIITGIFARMGFTAIESRELDDDYHMFTSLNFPPNHPARAEYDTFITTDGLVAPAHTSTMQNRILKQYKGDLEAGKPIAAVIPGRTFRNEDVDARHDHTFYQLEGVYVGEGVHAGMLVATIRTWLSNYFGKELKIKIQPGYFPFTEPSFEFAASCPFCDEAGCNVCSYSGWIELGGCGMIHPSVLKEAGIDPVKYSGFAWGFGIERLVMLKYNIEDIRHFESANLKFLEQFK